MRSFYIDTLNTNLKIHDTQNANDFWLYQPLEGLDSPDYRVSAYDKAGEDGSIVASQHYGARLVTLTGYFKGTTDAQFEASRKLLSAALAIRRDSNGRPIAKRCQFTTLGGDTYFFDAYLVSKPVFSMAKLRWSEFMIQLTVPTTSILSTTTVNSGAITRPSGGGFVLPVILPIVSSGSTGGSATVTNSGDMVAMPSLTLTGPLTNPYIRNAAANKSMQLTYTIPAASYVTISMLEKTILLNGTSSVLSTKTDDSEWWGIEPGSNQIIFSTGSNSDTGTLQVTFNSSYAGI